MRIRWFTEQILYIGLEIHVTALMQNLIWQAIQHLDFCRKNAYYLGAYSRSDYYAWQRSFLLDANGRLPPSPYLLNQKTAWSVNWLNAARSAERSEAQVWTGVLQLQRRHFLWSLVNILTSAASARTKDLNGKINLVRGSRNYGYYATAHSRISEQIMADKEGDWV